jgi:UDP-glucuronate decarboxylase
LGSLNVLNLAVEKKAKILFTSTSEVYGDPEVHPQPESYRGSVNPIGIRACYDEGKRCAESIFYDFHRMHGIDIKVARLFNTYGPLMRSDDGRVVSNFICQSISGTPITIYGDGTQTRSFCYVDDLILGLKKLMSSGSSVLYPVNLGNPSEFTLLELVEEIEKIVNTKLTLEFLPLPLDDPKIRKPDIQLARTALNWEPSVDLRDGLKDTYNYFLKELKK